MTKTYSSWLGLPAQSKDLARWERDFRVLVHSHDTRPRCIRCHKRTSSETFICPCDTEHPVCDDCYPTIRDSGVQCSKELSDA